jgi:hypothetical protein
MYLSSSGRDLVYLLEGILHGELAASTATATTSRAGGIITGGAADTTAATTTTATGGVLEAAAGARWNELAQQRRALLARLEVLDRTDRDMAERFVELRRAMQCTTPELERFWAQVWAE